MVPRGGKSRRRLREAYLGMAYFKGEVAPKDYSEGVKWVPEAADQGNVRGQYQLGVTYFLGQGVPKDNIQAYMWFTWRLRKGTTGLRRASACSLMLKICLLTKSLRRNG